MPMNAKKKPRRIFGLLSYPKFQLMILVNTIICFAVVYAATFWFLHLSLEDLKAMGNALDLPQEHAYFKIFSIHYRRILTAVTLGFLCGVGLATLGTLALTHAMVGPLDRLRRYFENMAEGSGRDVPPIDFRKGDFLRDLAPAINRGIQRLTKEP